MGCGGGGGRPGVNLQERRGVSNAIYHIHSHSRLSFLDDGVDSLFSLLPFEQFSSLLSLLEQ